MTFAAEEAGQILSLDAREILLVTESDGDGLLARPRLRPTRCSVF